MRCQECKYGQAASIDCLDRNESAIDAASDTLKFIEDCYEHRLHSDCLNRVDEKCEFEDIVSNVQVFGLEESIRRAKFPKAVNIDNLNYDLTNGIKHLGNAEKGSGHDSFLKGIVVQLDLTFTVKAWTQAQRYHWFEIISSQSTMHKLLEFDFDTAYVKYVDDRIKAIMKEKVSEYNEIKAKISELESDGSANKEELAKLRDDLNRKHLEILYNNPCGCKLTAGITTSYLQLKTILGQREFHRIPEWRAVAKWIRSLPRFEELCASEISDRLK